MVFAVWLCGCGRVAVAVWHAAWLSLRPFVVSLKRRRFRPDFVEFSGEENNGRFLDLHAQHEVYVNLKGTTHVEYLDYIQTFHELAKFPREHKSTAQYLHYIEGLLAYLCDFHRRAFPLVNLAKVRRAPGKGASEALLSAISGEGLSFRSGVPCLSLALPFPRAPLLARVLALPPHPPPPPPPPSPPPPISHPQHLDEAAAKFEEQWASSSFPGWEGVKPAESHSQVDLSKYNAASELEQLGMERLKGGLLALGLKCGGTLQQRAARLFSVKGKTPEQFDKSIVAKKSAKVCVCVCVWVLASSGSRLLLFSMA